MTPRPPTPPRPLPLVADCRPGRPLRVDHPGGSLVLSVAGPARSGRGFVRLLAATYGAGVTLSGRPRDSEAVEAPVGSALPLLSPGPSGVETLLVSPVASGPWGVRLAFAGPRSFAVDRPRLRAPKGGAA